MRDLSHGEVVRLDERRITTPPVSAVVERAAEVCLVERYVRRLEAGVGAGAAPRPVEWIIHEACLDRVECEIPERAEEIVVAVYLSGERMREKEMRAAFVPSVVAARIAGVKELEGVGDACIFGGD